MAEHSANQTDDDLSWHFSGRPAVAMSRRVMQGIEAEAKTMTHGQSMQRLEVGGILLGHREEKRILIEDFEPVLCDHCFGPSYLLVGEDRVAMEETLNWFRNGSPLSILGWYRSITRPDFSFENEAIDLLLPTPLGSGDVALLLFPHRAHPHRIQFLFKGQGELLEAPLPLVEESTFAEPHEPAAPSGSAEAGRETQWLGRPTPGAPSAPAESEHYGSFQSENGGTTQAILPVVAPPPHPLHASDDNRYRGWLWLASAVVFGAILAYVSVREPKRSFPHPAPVAVIGEKQLRSRDAATKQGQEKGPMVSQPPRQDSADRIQPANAGHGSTDVQIRNFLENWAETAKAGDIERATSMYAERLSTFFNKRNATRADVRQERNLNLARYGRMSVYRISDIQIQPVSDNEVSVTFRKMWRSIGPRVTSGEEKEQLTLVRNATVWQIAAEKEIKVYWVRKPHLLAR